MQARSAPATEVAVDRFLDLERIGMVAAHGTGALLVAEAAQVAAAAVASRGADTALVARVADTALGGWIVDGTAAADSAAAADSTAAAAGIGGSSLGSDTDEDLDTLDSLQSFAVSAPQHLDFASVQAVGAEEIADTVRLLLSWSHQ